MKRFAILFALLAIVATGTMAGTCEIDLGKDMPHSGDTDTSTSP
jgi:hypothetical protein